MNVDEKLWKLRFLSFKIFKSHDLKILNPKGEGVETKDKQSFFDSVLLETQKF